MNRHKFFFANNKMTLCEISDDPSAAPQVLEVIHWPYPSSEEKQKLVEEYVPGGKMTGFMMEIVAPELDPDTLEKYFSTIEDNLRFNFIVDDHGMYTGYGHQNKREFANEINDYEGVVNLGYIGDFSEKDIKYTYIRPFHPDTEGIFEECSADSWHAIPVTTMWSQYW